MKKKLLFGLPAMVLALGFVFFGCSNPTSNEKVDDPLVKRETINGKSVKITISRTDLSKAAVLTPRAGDFYKIEVDNVLASKGTITSADNGNLTFTPSTDSPGPKTPFTGTFNNGSLKIPSIPYAGGTLTGFGTTGSGNTSGGGGGGGSFFKPTPDPTPSTPEQVSFISENIEIVITQNLSRAAYQPKTGDNYVLKLNGGEASKGRVTLTGSALTFTPQDTRVDSFTANLSGDGLGNISPIQYYDGGSLKTIDLKSVILGIQNNDVAAIGIANTAPVDTGSAIGGCAYSDSESGTRPSDISTIGTHYLISGDYATAKAALEVEWGSPNEDSETSDHFVSIMNGDSNTAYSARKNGGVLFEVGTITHSGGTFTDYRLAEWDEAEWAWKVSIWPDGGSVTSPADDGTSSIGVLTYDQKDSFSGQTLSYSWKHYILSIDYDTALATLKALWGEPLTGWSLQTGNGAKTQAAYQADGVVFEELSLTNSYGSWYEYRLAKVGSTMWEAVGWSRY